MSIEIPGNEDRTVVIGRTGSGKTQCGMWLLSMQDIDRQPWIVVDYKREDKIGRIPWAQYVAIGQVPRSPGIYIVQPLPSQETEMDDYLTEIWDHEDIGLYIDEGYMMARSAALDTILIQGRSKRIPVIMLTQRPVGISRFAFSEAQYFAVFPNHDRRERKTIAEFTPLFNTGDLDQHLLPPYHFYWYDVSGNKLSTLKPVPRLNVIYNAFAARLKPPELLEKAAPRFTAL